MSPLLQRTLQQRSRRGSEHNYHRAIIGSAIVGSAIVYSEIV